jgi:hypothetical protein
MAGDQRDTLWLHLPGENTIGWKQIQIKQALTEVERKQK